MRRAGEAGSEGECIFSKPYIIVFGSRTDARTGSARKLEKKRGVTASDIEEDVLGIISWIVFGLIAGIIAKLIMPGRDPGGCIITMLLGIAGAFVGGFLYRLLTGREVFFHFDLGSLVVAVVGAIVILAFYRLIARR